MARPRSLLLLLTLSTALTACRPGPTPRLTADIPYPIPEPFAAWLEERGGLVLGAPLSPAHEEAGLVRQVFVAGEMVFDPSAPKGSAVRLAPLGRTLGLAEPPVPPVLEPGWRYFEITGHNLHPDFAAAFDRLGGVSVFGPPIAEAQFAEGLVLQPFENLGLVRLAAGVPGEIGLLAYGLAAHAELNAPVDLSEAVLPPRRPSRPFAAFLDRYGGEALFGRALSEPRLAEDGLLEQAFERAVIAAPPYSPEVARLRPLGLWLGPAEPGVEPSPKSGTIFFPLTGHNVVGAFADFYRHHDGWQLLGLPLEEAEVVDGHLQQRFENAVLILRPDLPAPLMVQLAPLGLAYGGSDSPAPTPAPTPAIPHRPPPDTPAAVTTWVAHPVLVRGQVQRAFIRVLGPDGLPLEGVVAIVQVDGPRTQQVFSPAPTQADGQTEFEIDLADLRPGEIVIYQVFVSGEYGIGYAAGSYIAALSLP